GWPTRDPTAPNASQSWFGGTARSGLACTRTQFSPPVRRAGRARHRRWRVLVRAARRGVAGHRDARGQKRQQPVWPGRPRLVSTRTAPIHRLGLWATARRRSSPMRLNDALVRHYLANSLVMRLATVSGRGAPSLTPIWFV